jgi:hypothetical protein
MYQRITQTITIGAAETDISSASISPINANQTVKVIVVTIPTWTNTVTATIYYKTDGAKVLWTVAGLAKTTVTPYVVSLPLMDDLETRVVLSCVPGGSGGTVTVYYYVDED